MSFFLVVGSYCFILQIGGGYNIHNVATRVSVGTIKESRQLRLQSFNAYRKRFNLRPYTSFSDFTGRTQDFHPKTHTQAHVRKQEAKNKSSSCEEMMGLRECV